MHVSPWLAGILAPLHRSSKHAVCIEQVVLYWPCKGKAAMRSVKDLPWR